MPKFNISVFLNTYADAKGSNAPNFQNFKWNREINGVAVTGATSQMQQIAPGASATIFSNLAATFMYLEVSGTASVVVNGGAAQTLNPVVAGGCTLPGIMMQTSDINSLTITNPSQTDTLTVFVATVE